MKITKTCVYTNQRNSMEIDITQEQYQQYVDGVDLDLCCPDITRDEKEFLLTGALPEDIDEVYDYDDPYEEISHSYKDWD